jgi:peptidoglycan/LPS O-acetylase OafA/YrhL
MMLHKRFRRISPAMVVAMLALFAALTGTAVATSSTLITGKQIKDSSITGADVKNRSLTPRDFRGSVQAPAA